MDGADSLLEELATVGPSHAPSMGKLQKVRYTHDGMIDLGIQNPWISQNDIARHFGYSVSWISNVFASDAFQARLAARREEVVDPELKATLKERFQALVIRSLQVLQTKLNAPQVSDNVALRAAELGAKALGLGGHAAPPPPPAPGQDRLVILAARLVALKSNVDEGVIDGQVLSSSTEVR